MFWRDLLALLELALEAAVGLLWLVVETVMSWLARLAQFPRRRPKRPPPQKNGNGGPKLP